jgi:hypothetical protein
MISVLIPVFNVDIRQLVLELHKQLSQLSIPGEILVYDDFSEESFKKKNREIQSLLNISYKELRSNSGRVQMRKLLAADASNQWLLFLDSDSAITCRDFLINYSAILKNEDEIYTGGRDYQEQLPQDCNKRLHWKYGKFREAVQGKRRVLHVNNFCIEKGLFLNLDFPSQLQGYGHEDTWMQIELERLGKRIVFFDNPVVHEGLEDSAVFLSKTRNALKNLLVLKDRFDMDLLCNRVTIYKFYRWLKRLGLSYIIGSLLKKRIRTIESRLLSCNPSLFQFDLYKVYHLLQIEKHVQH